MKKVSSFLLSFTLFVWILPLGAFIRPSSEKDGCGGNRAVCLCTMGLSKMRKDSGTQKVSFTNASGVEKTNRSASGSSGSDFMTAALLAKKHDKNSRFLELNLILPKQTILFTLDPVPKA